MKSKKKRVEWVKKLQQLYLDGKITSDEAFEDVTNFLKYGLMKYLIKSKTGYYIQCVRQDRFSEEVLIDCYTYVMEHILGTFVKNSGKSSKVKYDPNRANIVSFMNSWVQGFCGLILSKQRKLHKYGAEIVYSLDDVLVNYESSNFTEHCPFLLQEDCIDEDIFFGESNLTYYDKKDLDNLEINYIEQEVNKIFNRI